MSAEKRHPLTTSFRELVLDLPSAHALNVAGVWRLRWRAKCGNSTPADRDETSVPRRTTANNLVAREQHVPLPKRAMAGVSAVPSPDYA